MKHVVISAVVAFSVLGGPANAQSPILPNVPSVSSQGHVHRTDGGDAAFAAGVAVGVLGGLAVPRAPRRYYYDAPPRSARYRRYRKYRRLCREWRWMCRDGSERACWKYDERC